MLPSQPPVSDRKQRVRSIIYDQIPTARWKFSENRSADHEIILLKSLFRKEKKKLTQAERILIYGLCVSVCVMLTRRIYSSEHLNKSSRFFIRWLSQRTAILGRYIHNLDTHSEREMKWVLDLQNFQLAHLLIVLNIQMWLLPRSAMPTVAELLFVLVVVLMIVSVSFVGLAVCLIIIFVGIGCARRLPNTSSFTSFYHHLNYCRLYKLLTC